MAKYGDVEEWLKSIFGRMFGVAREPRTDRRRILGSQIQTRYELYGFSYLTSLLMSMQAHHLNGAGWIGYKNLCRCTKRKTALQDSTSSKPTSQKSITYSKYCQGSFVGACYAFFTVHARIASPSISGPLLTAGSIYGSRYLCFPSSTRDFLRDARLPESVNSANHRN